MDPLRAFSGTRTTSRRLLRGRTRTRTSSRVPRPPWNTTRVTAERLRPVIRTLPPARTRLPAQVCAQLTFVMLGTGTYVMPPFWASAAGAAMKVIDRATPREIAPRVSKYSLSFSGLRG
jgi:hypothetical protein